MSDDIRREWTADDLLAELDPGADLSPTKQRHLAVQNKQLAEFLAECTRLWAVCKRHDAVELLLAGPVRMHITAMCKPEGARMNKSVRRGSPPCRHGFNIWGEKVADCKPWCDRKPEGGK